MSEAPPRSNWLAFAAATVFALGLGFCIFIGMALGECLPRDGSAAMHACDSAKRLEFFAFPGLLIATLVAAAVLMWSRRRLAVLIGFASPFIALAAVLLLERLPF